MNREQKEAHFNIRILKFFNPLTTRHFNFEQWMNSNTSQAHKNVFFHPLIILKFFMLVLEHLHGIDIEDYTLLKSYRPKYTNRFVKK